jgi:hypothetical protein
MLHNSGEVLDFEDDHECEYFSDCCGELSHDYDSTICRNCGDHAMFRCDCGTMIPHPNGYMNSSNIQPKCICTSCRR